MRGREIKLLIRSKGLTQATVAENIGVTREYLNKLLKYEEVDSDMANKIIQYLNSVHTPDNLPNKETNATELHEALAEIQKLKGLDLRVKKLEAKVDRLLLDQK